MPAHIRQGGRRRFRYCRLRGIRRFRGRLHRLRFHLLRLRRFLRKRPGDGRLERRFRPVVQQFIQGYLIKLAEMDQVLQGRQNLPPLPLGNRLPGDVKRFGHRELAHA